MSEGWCMTSRTDEPLDMRGYCVPHGTLAIPPSFGDRFQRWTAGGWEPLIEKPANHTPRPTYTAAAPKAGFSPPKNLACSWCKRFFTSTARGGAEQRFCGAPCKSKAWTARGSPRRAGSRPRRRSPPATLRRSGGARSVRAPRHLRIREGAP